MNTSRTVLLSLGLAAFACGGAAGTRPGDMSATEHEAAAQQEEQAAAGHEAQHDPAAAKAEETCTAGRGRVCWTETNNPTEGHHKSAAEHQKLAGQHRTASKALADAEASACAGIDPSDRDISPFARTADIRSVSQFREEKPAGKGQSSREAGATVVFRAAPGLTAEWLQRILDCHLARNAAVGHDMPEMAYCPLVPKGAKATVRSVGDGFAVDVQGDDAATVAEIWKRAQQITPTP